MIRIKCAYCSHAETKVLDKRDVEDSAVVRRRRECQKCEKRFTTYEHVELEDLWVVKKNGKRERFDRQKLRSGMLKACEKRPIPAEKIDKAISDIEAALRKKNDREVASEAIGQLVMSRLKRLDKVAYIRFASVYREFTDLDTFKDEVDRLLKK